LESKDLSQCIPCQELLIEQNDNLEDAIDEHIQACVEKEGKFACLYFPSGGEVTVDLGRLKRNQLQMWWFNPRDGQCYSQENLISEEVIGEEKVLNRDEKSDLLKIKTPTRGSEQDWVCVIENGKNDSTIPGQAKKYGDIPVPSEIKKTFMW
jgi:hypothetical protein